MASSARAARPTVYQVRTDDGFEVGEPTALFETSTASYGVHPDGGRSFVVVQGEYVAEDRIVVTVNALAR